MNYLDIVLVVFLILSAIHGFSKGFVEELAGLVALILGIWAAIHFSDIVARFLTENLHITFQYLSVVAFLLTFIVVVILVHLIGSFFNKLVHSVALGFLNRLAGLVFGVIKGALILSMILVIFHKINEDTHIISESTKADSKLYNPIRNFTPGIFPFLDIWGDHSAE